MVFNGVLSFINYIALAIDPFFGLLLLMKFSTSRASLSLADDLGEEDDSDADGSTDMRVIVIFERFLTGAIDVSGDLCPTTEKILRSL